MSMAGVGPATQRASEPAMESWMLDVKRVRIPRPKVQSGAAAGRYPAEPPKDYLLTDLADDKAKRALALDKVTEELRRGIQDKL